MVFVNPPHKQGDPRATCDRCGMIVHLSDLKREWTNYMVCARCWEPRHPQEFIKAREDKQALPNARHVQTTEELVFVAQTFPPGTGDL